VILLVGMLVMAVAYRRSFCGMLCPLGTLQGIFGAAGRRLFRRRFAVPRAVDRVARYLKYAVLVFFALWTWRAAELVLRPYDPWVAWAHLTSADLLTTYGIGLAVLVVSLAGSLVYDRFFCKYLCPAGALLGLLSRVSFLSIRRDAEACIDCGRCDKACMMNIEVAAADVVKSSECISCNECVNVCPVPGALKVTAPGGARASSLAATGAVVALMVGIVGATTLSGSFAWKSPGLAEAAAESRGSSSGGSFDLMLIKGYTTLAEVSEATGIPGEELAATFGVPAEDLGLPIKDIKDTYGFTPEDVRAYVEMRLQQ
jgi:polyferredoxin